MEENSRQQCYIERMDQDFPSFQDIIRAYRSCRLGKRASIHQARFEFSLGRNLLELHRDLLSGKYRPSPVICFVVTMPKPREIFAAHFRDRIVHHLVVSRLTQAWENKFIHASYACRVGKGTHGALKYLQKSVRRISRGGVRPVLALQLDLASFFVTIHRPTLCRLLTKDVRNPTLRSLVETLYLHDARPRAILKGSPELFRLIPKEKSWFSQGSEEGLPIGNLTSQFGANVYLTALDHFIERELKPMTYLRYMDDLTLLDDDPQKLMPFAAIIDGWLKKNRRQNLNPRKTLLTDLRGGIEYLGYHGVQTDSPKEPFQLYLRPQRKWDWIQDLNALERMNVESFEKNHVLSARVPSPVTEQALARVNSRLGHLRHARSYRLRKDSFAKFLANTTENNGLPPEIGESSNPWKVKRDLTGLRAR